ncbi:MAG: mevalonate kinase [Labilithrix sp.]
MNGHAHGKVILFGEHAVVHGVPAIAVGIDRGARAVATSSPAPSTLRVAGWNITATEGASDTPLDRAWSGVLAATRAAGTAVPNVHIEAEADLPPGGGLGCSAALGVAVARALDAAAASEEIARRADAWERVFHGNPSGIDAAVSSLGGCVRFQRTDEGPKISRIRIPAPVHLCIGNSGQISSTKSMVEAVARLKERRPETTQKAFEAIHTLVKNAELALIDGDRRSIGQLLDLNQMLLSGLFVSTPEIEQMCGAARSAGALGAKLTGAGGGGCVVALVDGPPAAEAVLAAWKHEGFDGFHTTFGAHEPRRNNAAMQTAP